MNWNLYLEKWSPWLAQQIMGAASKWGDPFTFAMGFEVLVFHDEKVQVRLPSTWRVWGRTRAIHTSALLALAEHVSEIFWQRHLAVDLAICDVKGVQAQFFRTARGAVVASLHISHEEREAWLYEVRNKGWADVTANVQIYDESEARVAVVAIAMCLRGQTLLNSGNKKDEHTGN